MDINSRIFNNTLKSQGYLTHKLNLPLEVKELVVQRNWVDLDRWLAKSLDSGELKSLLTQHLDYQFIEHILALRSAPDDDGIWHDDGSRLLAFSLSLCLDHQSIEGGELFFRHKSRPNEVTTIPNRPFGTITLFLTGQFGFDHKVGAVTKGERLICAG